MQEPNCFEGGSSLTRGGFADQQDETAAPQGGVQVWLHVARDVCRDPVDRATLFNGLGRVYSHRDRIMQIPHQRKSAFWRGDLQSTGSTAGRFGLPLPLRLGADGNDAHHGRNRSPQAHASDPHSAASSPIPALTTAMATRRNHGRYGPPAVPTVPPPPSMARDALEVPQKPQRIRSRRVRAVEPCVPCGAGSNGRIGRPRHRGYRTRSVNLPTRSNGWLELLAVRGFGRAVCGSRRAASTDQQRPRTGR